MALLFVIGLVSLLGQVVLLRELSVAFYGIELIYVLALSLWMLSTAAGAMAGHEREPSVLQVQYLLAAFALLLPVDLVFIRAIRLIFSEVPGAYLAFHTQILVMTMALLPIGFLSGLAFRWAARLYVHSGGSLAWAYGIESLGGLMGGLSATILLMIRVQNLAAASLCALVSLCFALWTSSQSSDRLEARQQWFRIAGSVLAGILVATMIRSSVLDRVTTGWTHKDLIVTRDTPYGRLTVTGRHGQIVVFENDALSFESESTSAEEFVHLAALQHPDPQNVLMLGGGIEGHLARILEHNPRSADYVELNAQHLDILPLHLPEDLRQSLHSPKVRIIQADPRAFLEGSPDYDLILVGMPEPSSGQANRFYTREFFEQCAKRLNPKGVVAFRIRSAENFWTPQLSRQMTSIYSAFKRILPQVIVIPGTTNVFIGSKSTLERDPAILLQRLEARGIRGRIVSAPYLRYMLQNDRFSQVATLLEKGFAPENTDIHPICYQYAIMIWLSKFFPEAAVIDAAESLRSLQTSYAFWSIVAVCLLLIVWIRRKDRPRRFLLVALAGLVGMALETILLLHYQVKRGILFQDIGLLLMSFMGGLALGALFLARPAGCDTERRGPGPYIAVALLAGSALLALWIGWRIHTEGSVRLVETMLLLALAGSFVSGVFVYSGRGSPEHEKRLIGSLYAADLIGGCLGSTVAGLLLIPTSGLAATSFLMVPISFLCLLLLQGRLGSKNGTPADPALPI